MVRRLTFFILLAVFFTPVVVAIDTNINVRTLPNHKVSIFVLDPGQVYYLLESFHIEAGSTGEVSATYSDSWDKIKVNVKISKDGETVMLEEFGIFDAGSSLHLQVKPGDVSDDYKTLDEEAAKAVEETAAAEAAAAEAEAESVEQTTAETSEGAVTGSAVTENSASRNDIPQFIYYIIGAMLFVGVLVFLLIARKRASSPVLSPQQQKNEIMLAEKKILEAQKEINRLKNQEKIKEAEKRILRDKKELERLKRGEASQSASTYNPQMQDVGRSEEPKQDEQFGK